MPRTASVRLVYLFITLALLGAATVFPGRLVAQSTNVLVITSVTLDRANIHTLGVQVLISGDQDRDAQVTVRYRPVGSNVWRDGLPLFRVHPETSARPVPQQFAGSVFDLLPDTLYEIELRATDPDGPVAQPVWTRTDRTRPVPRQDPLNPIIVNVTPSTFRAALDSAQPGHVIILANGTYPGSFFAIDESGTPDNPIVIRGQSVAGVVLDGQNCPDGTDCNVLDVLGSYVHVENLTIQNAYRALRFLNPGTRNNVARRLRIQNVVHGITSNSDQLDFYISDNVVEGRLTWPSLAFEDPNGIHWNDFGIAVNGDGHVVYHNRISGFGDPMISMKRLARSIDFYGNDIVDNFDGTELDFGGGNVRAIHNRFTNVAAGISLQPLYGGPAYVLRNVLLNVTEDHIKLKPYKDCPSCPLEEPSGALIYHNTFVSPLKALNLQTSATSHNIEVKNNLFVGPRLLSSNWTVDWTGLLDQVKFDFNGYFPDGGFRFGTQTFPNFASLQASGIFEAGGTLLTEPIFAGGFVGPAGDGMPRQNPTNFNLASGSNAINRGAYLPGINALSGGAPDLGALEFGCSTPTYGPRPAGSENLVAAVDCSAQPPQPSLPSPWTNRDIGSVGLAGSASYSNGTFTVNGSGADIWDVADQFHFVYQSLNGDGQIVARVASVENTDQFAKAGVMIRETLTAGSRHAILDLKPDGGLEFMTRNATGGSTSVVTGGTTVAIPHWLKLARSGNTFTASRSSDGITWTVMGSTTVTMAPNVYVGLAVTSHNNTVLNTSTFSNVSVTTDSDFWTDLVGVTVNSSNGLTKTSNTTGWNAGAYSVQTLTGDGYVEFSTDENSTGKTCGLSADFTGQNYIGIDYAIALVGGNQARIYENGVQKGTFAGNYLPGQRYRVSIEGTTVKYYKDGVAHSYTGTVSPTHSLRVDTSLSTPGATITNVVFFSKLTWTNLVGATVNSSNDLTKTSTTTGWNAGATSVQTLSDKGYVEFSTDNATTGKACGLNSNHIGQNYTEIDFVITLGASGYIRIYEEGIPIPKPGTTNDYLFGRYAAGDVFRVEIDNGVVRYHRNGEVLIQHAISAASQYVVDTSLLTTGAKITDAVVVSGAWSD